MKNMSKTTKSSLITYGLVVLAYVVAEIFMKTGHMTSLLKGLLVPLCVYAILAVSLNLTVGILGELSLGHAGFMCVGAFSSAFFSKCMRDVIENSIVRFLLAFSNEMYGENRGDVEFYDEDYCGYIKCNTLRAGYPESKRCSEALCQAYKQQKGLDVVIARLTRSYGPTMNMSDTKAVSQFIKRGVAGEDIILKSEGTQYFSYTYMSDAVSGLLWVLLTG